ncbi:MAG: TetR/AcrR family transcriptional regulator [Victivallales bacterium]|nr:TetR/AcrR family transcriptional regulator [Victivallales bacterium]
MARLSIKQRAALDELMQKNICAAATGVIVEHGIQKMTMDKVAEAAGIAKGTIYNYFHDRKELLQTIAGSIFNPLERQITEISQSALAPLKKLYETAKVLLETFNRHKKLFVLMHEANVSGMFGKNSRPLENREKLLAVIRKICEQAISEQSVKPENPDILAEIFLGMVMSINISKIGSTAERPAEADLKVIMSVFTKGCRLFPCREEKNE